MHLLRLCVAYSPSRAESAQAAHTHTEHTHHTHQAQPHRDTRPPDGLPINLTLTHKPNPNPTPNPNPKRPRPPDGLPPSPLAAAAAPPLLLRVADGSAVLAGGNSKFVCLYDVAERQLLRKYALSNNVSLDGVRMHLDSRALTEAGPEADLLLSEDSDDAVGLPPPPKGVLRRSERVTKLAIRASCVRFAPDGRSWAAASTEGLLVYAVDDALQFDPTGLELETTPAAVGLALVRGEHGRALPMALCLNEEALIRGVWQQTPTSAIELVAASLPPPYLQRLLTFLGAELESSRHLHAILLWVKQLLASHSQRLRDQRMTYEVPLRAIHKGVCNRYDELSKTCHSNQYAVDFLLDQIEQAARARTVAAAEDEAAPPTMTAPPAQRRGAKRGLA